MKKESLDWAKYLAADISENVSEKNWPAIDPTRTDFEANLRFVANLIGAAGDAELMLMRFKDGMTFKNIAKAKSLSANTISVRIQNILDKVLRWPFYEYLACGVGENPDDVYKNKHGFLSESTSVRAICFLNNIRGRAISGKLSVGGFKTIGDILRASREDLLETQGIGESSLVSIYYILTTAGFRCEHLAPPAQNGEGGKSRPPAASMLFIGKGTYSIGATTTDANGNVIKSVPPHWEPSDEGGSIVVGKMYARSKRQIGSAEVYGDWDAAGYLEEILRLLSPARPINIPDFRAISNNAQKDGQDWYLCEYCTKTNCRDCIVRRWREENEELENGN